MKVTIIGTGYVGLTTGLTLAYLGHDVVCVDIDEAKLEQLKAGSMPFFEPHLAELLDLVTARLQFSNDLTSAIRSSEVSFITVGTPPNPDGSADLSAVAAVARAIGSSLAKDQRHVVVNKSTVPIGAANYVESLVREGYSSNYQVDTAGLPFMVASNPEFLREGSAIHDSLYPDRIVIGVSHEQALHLLQRLLQPLIEQTFTAPSFLPRPRSLAAVPLVTTDVVSAETTKYAANAFLATKISFINEIAGLAEHVGADIQEIARGIGLDSRIGQRFLQAGIGWGGSCFGKDTQAMISSGRDYAYAMPLLEATLCVNQQQRFIVVKKLQSELKVLKGRTIGLLGLAFKPNTDDLRDAPSLDIIQELHRQGAHVRVHDPVAMPACQRHFPELPVSYKDQLEQLAQDADALVLITEWDDYLEQDYGLLQARMQQALIIDGRNALDGTALVKLGFRYIGVGRG